MTVFIGSPTRMFHVKHHPDGGESGARPLHLVNALVDNERMRKSPATYVKVSPTQHWRRVGDEWGRDWIARNLSTGELRLVTYRESVTA
jgi:hypothetical protein